MLIKKIISYVSIASLILVDTTLFSHGASSEFSSDKEQLKQVKQILIDNSQSSDIDPKLTAALRDITHPDQITVKNLDRVIQADDHLSHFLGWMGSELQPEYSSAHKAAVILPGLAIAGVSSFSLSRIFAEDPGVAYFFGYLGTNNSNSPRAIGALALIFSFIPEAYAISQSFSRLWRYFQENEDSKRANKKRAEDKFLLGDLVGKSAVLAYSVGKLIVQIQIYQGIYKLVFFDGSSFPYSQFLGTVSFFAYSQLVNGFDPNALWWSHLYQVFIRGKNKKTRAIRRNLRKRAAAAYRHVWDMNDQDVLTTVMLLGAVEEKYPGPQYQKARNLLSLIWFLDPHFTKKYEYVSPRPRGRVMRMLINMYDPVHPWYHNGAKLVGRTLGLGLCYGAYYLYQYSGAQSAGDIPETGIPYLPSARATAEGVLLGGTVTTLAARSFGDEVARWVDHMVGYQPNLNEHKLKEHIRIGKGGLGDRLISADFLSQVWSTLISRFLSLPLPMQAVSAMVLTEYTATGHPASRAKYNPAAGFTSLGEGALLQSALGRKVRDAIRLLHESSLFNCSKSPTQIADLARHGICEDMTKLDQLFAGGVDEGILSVNRTLNYLHAVLHPTERVVEVRVDDGSTSNTASSTSLPGGPTPPVVLEDSSTSLFDDRAEFDAFTKVLRALHVRGIRVTPANMEGFAKHWWNNRTKKPQGRVQVSSVTRSAPTGSDHPTAHYVEMTDIGGSSSSSSPSPDSSPPKKGWIARLFGR